MARVNNFFFYEYYSCFFTSMKIEIVTEAEAFFVTFKKGTMSRAILLFSYSSLLNIIPFSPWIVH